MGDKGEYYHGLKAEALLLREDRRWTIWLLSEIWVEKDLRAELDDGTVFVMKRDGRTNGIYFEQADMKNI